MGSVLGDVTDDNIDTHHVLRRVDDWEARVKRLYATVSEGCPRAEPPERVLRCVRTRNCCAGSKWMHGKSRRFCFPTARERVPCSNRAGSGRCIPLTNRVSGGIRELDRFPRRCATANRI